MKTVQTRLTITETLYLGVFSMGIESVIVNDKSFNPMAAAAAAPAQITPGQRLNQ